MSRKTQQTALSSPLLRAKQGEHVLILRVPGLNLGRGAVQALLENGGARGGEDMHICHGADAPETYAYVIWQADQVAASRIGEAAGRLYPDAEAVVMEVAQALEGSAAGSLAQWHYIVETDVAPPAEDDFNAWYTQEHLPGLASVPGTVRAVRLYGADTAPRYHALYLLETRETFGSPPWLAVRATEWSGRVRPHFQNTKRTMFAIETQEGN